jgi:hypothetical protein
MLVIVGDGAANKVTVTQNDQADTLTVVADGVTKVYRSSQIDQIGVDLKGGSDYFWYGLAAGSNFLDLGKKVTVNLGAGNDQAWLDFRGNGGPARLLGTLDVTVYGGAGNDEMFGNFPAVANDNIIFRSPVPAGDFARQHIGALNVTALMGDGDDNASVNLWGNVTGGARVSLDLQGGNGNDSLNTWATFNGGYNRIGIDYFSAVTINMDGGAGSDSLYALYGGQLNGRLTLRENGGQGNDTLTAEVHLMPGSTGSFDGEVLGGAGDDRMSFQLFVSPPSRVRVINALMDGGEGIDTKAATTPNVTVRSCELPRIGIIGLSGDELSAP